MKVTIRVYERTEYCDTIEMSAAQFKKYEKLLGERRDFRLLEEIGCLINRDRDTWLDGDIEDVEIQKEEK